MKSRILSPLGLPAVLAALLAVGTTLLLAGCAGATLNSGVGDAFLERAPWYAGRPAAEVQTVAYLPVAYQRGATMPVGFDPDGGPGTPLATLVAAMNAYMDSLPLPGVVGPLDPPGGTPPDVRFGCETDIDDECAPRDESVDPGDRNPRMHLAVGRPSGSWTAGAAGALDEAGADALLVLTLEIGQYWPRQTNWKGSKEVELGTDHAVALPWLTGLDTPVSVLQLTGALVGPDGRAMRIGAEGLRARRTSLLAGGFGFQALVTDEDVEALMSERRLDLPGRPLVWQAAMDALVRELIGAE